MGAKQSKRSVDISGKEAEGAGEVAAAGAGGEGRVEQLADADALKPQLNGDAHIHEPSDKEKQLDSGTPENEKDATTEKEGKEQEEEKEKESTPVTNGDAEQKEENGESTPLPDDGKKPKKEKVKKKWSLRSISFSRKDKPKQEKKQKEEELKANGEPEKVPEEIAETPDTEKNDIVKEDKAETEIKEERTPETPVTEPITNGSSTPETPKEESLTADEPIATVIEENDRPEIPKVEVTTEKISVNGLTAEESKIETPVAVESENSKPEEPTIEKTEPVPATEIPVINEEVLSTSDKMKELIPEVPTIPELKTEIETTTDVAVAN
ncbi:A-kinase anchor protein 200 [Nymphalis io]|uniref:A-kinase anchor protein 200 n=1 Tax=Inachis io TaxID=171585 RepID=UPI002169241D|nr:A-kinase anchor protein 200 [Nymphalis io]XP_050346704.1 A-kinase anchor protein 200 [Nymphalis io]